MLKGNRTMKTGISGFIAIIITLRIILISIPFLFIFRSICVLTIVLFVFLRCPVDFQTRTRDFGLWTHRTRSNLFPDAPDRLHTMYDMDYALRELIVQDDERATSRKRSARRTKMFTHHRRSRFSTPAFPGSVAGVPTPRAPACSPLRCA